MDREIKRPFFSRYKNILYLFLAAVSVSGTWIFLKPVQDASYSMAADKLVISSVVTSTFEDFVPIRGLVTPLSTLYLDAVEGGRVEKVHVEDGALVTPGQLIVELSNTALQLDAISREAEVAQQHNNFATLELQLERNRLDHSRRLVELQYQVTRLKHEMDRIEPLYKKGVASKSDYIKNKDEYEYYTQLYQLRIDTQKSDERLRKAQMAVLEGSIGRLKSNLKFAQSNLDNLNIRAPTKGKLTAFDAEIGQSLKQGQRLGQIDDPDNYKITAQIDEFYLNRVDIGQTATAEVAGETYNIRLSKLYPQVTQGQFKADLVFQDRQPPGIRRGQTLQLKLTLGDPVQTLVIPNGPYYQDTGGNWVFVVTQGNSRAVRRQVKLGRRNTDSVEIEEGLIEGEQVITSPYSSFRDLASFNLKPSG